MNDSKSVPGVDLDIIKERVIVHLTITLTTQMHIGIGTDDTSFSPDSTILRGVVLKNFNTPVPYIPYTTIKGNFRSELEAVASSFQDKNEDSLSGNDNGIRYICESLPGQYCRVEEEGENKPFKSPCAVCGLFGAQDLASHVIISDAFPTEESIKKGLLKTKLKPGIAMDREKQVSKDKSLFFTETLHPGAEFEFTMILDNINQIEKPKEYQLLQVLFQLLMYGLISFGGKKSTGMGNFSIKKGQVKHLNQKDHFLFPENVESIEYKKFFGLNQHN